MVERGTQIGKLLAKRKLKFIIKGTERLDQAVSDINSITKLAKLPQDMTLILVCMNHAVLKVSCNTAWTWLKVFHRISGIMILLSFPPISTTFVLNYFNYDYSRYTLEKRKVLIK